MTIYTPSQIEKKPEKGSPDPEVVTEPLTSFKDEEDGVDAVTSPVQILYLQKKRRTFLIHLMLTIFILVVFACGAIGAVVFYRHFNKKVYSGVCGNLYYEDLDSKYLPDQWRDDPLHYKYVEENVTVSDQLEQLSVPKFDDVKASIVLHDFSRNYTAFMDTDRQNCYVMALNRTLIAPPRDLIDLLQKLRDGYYQHRAKVFGEKYRATLPPVDDLSIFGPDIAYKCSMYRTYKLEKFVSGVVKRSVKEITEDVFTYALMSHRLDSPVIMKIYVHEWKETDIQAA